MKFLEWLGFKKVMEDTEPSNVVKLPVEHISPVPPPEPPTPKEHYRVGFDDQGNTTLTLMTNHGSTMTLTMSQDSCEHLIRMLRSTYKEDYESES